MATSKERQGVFETARRLALGLGLIVAAAAVLLASDLRQRKTATHAREAFSIAIFQHASRPILDDAVRGTMDGLAETGFQEGRQITYTRFNAEGDLVTANAIAQSILQGGFDLVVTVSTPSLQTMANANQGGKLRHVFSVVTDPFNAGVGITGDGPGQHPDHLLGIGTFQPVRQTVQLAKQLYPALKTLGTVINPGEACSLACLDMAQDECRRLGLELLVAQVENTAGVYEAASSLTARNAEAFLIGGDNTIEAAIESVLRAANAARIPILAYAPDHAVAGALIGFGANYYDVGKTGGRLAGDLLSGKIDPRQFAVHDVMPRKLAVNLQTLTRLRDPWRLPEDVVAAADIVIDAEGRKQERGAEPPPPPLPPGKTWQLHMVSYSQSLMVEQWMKGFQEACDRLGLRPGSDYVLTYRNAQGDMQTANMMIDAAVDSRADLLLTITTPTLEAAVHKKPPMPVVFGLTANPLLAGAGESFTQHLPGFTGICTMSDYDGMAATVRECLPKAKRIGTLFNPSEDNSVFNKEKMEAALAKIGLALVARATSESSEVPAAAQALASSDVDAICQVAGNLHDAGFPAIAQAARQARKPLFSFVSGQAVSGGATVAVARDYEQGGRDHAALMLRVMLGENPTGIPFAAISRTIIVVNLDNAAQIGLDLPAALRQRADQVVGKKQ